MLHLSAGDRRRHRQDVFGLRSVGIDTVGAVLFSTARTVTSFSKMDIQRVPCTRCGAEILPATAEKTGGVCMPCHQSDDGLRYELVITGYVRGARKIPRGVGGPHGKRMGAGGRRSGQIERVIDGESVVVPVNSQQAVIRAAKALYEAGFTVELR